MSPFELRRVPKLTADASAEQRAGWPLAGVGALAAAPRAASDGPGADALHAAAPSLTASVLCVRGGFLRKNSRGLSFKAECLVHLASSFEGIVASSASQSPCIMQSGLGECRITVAVNLRFK